MKRHNLKKESTSSAKILEVANKLGLKDFNIYLRTDKLTSNQGGINLTDDYKNGTHWIAFQKKYTSIASAEPPRIISNQLAERHPQNFCERYISSNSIQNINDANCASYCLFFLFLMQDNSFYRTIMKIINDR